MDVRAALRQAIERLTAAQVPSATTTAEVLLLHVLGRDRAFLYAHPETPLTPDQERAYRQLVSERAAGKPTQYLTGQQEFWGLTFLVRPGVFIPRPETEHVVEAVLAVARRMEAERVGKSREGADEPLRIVDVGTGTGCIALALASELPGADIIALDIDPAALALARENAAALGLADRVRFLHSNLLNIFLEAARRDAQCQPFEARSPMPDARGIVSGSRFPIPGSRIDLIVSNPPYVSPTEAEQLPREVRDFEPPAALFSPGAGLEVTRRLIAQSAELLVAGGGWLVLELGYQMSSRVRSLLGEGWTNVEITPDLRGLPRVLAAQKQ
jgi:release factor glutamine methyltransferase